MCLFFRFANNSNRFNRLLRKLCKRALVLCHKMLCPKLNCFFLVFVLIVHGHCKKFSESEKPDWAKKDIRDYSDADMERLFDQWEEDDEPLEEDELPEYLRKPAKLDLSGLDPSNPEALLKLTKKGKTLMMFVTVKGTPTKQELEEITTLWQTSLMNNHIQTDRFVIGDNRAIFMFKDGSQAWEAKDYLVEQEQCQEVVIENKSYYGKHSDQVTTETSATNANHKVRDDL